MKAQAVAFPFDLFGSAGTGAGADCWATPSAKCSPTPAAETRPARSDAYRDHVRVREFPFETPAQLGRLAEDRPRGSPRTALKAGDRVLWLAGNHLAVLPAYEELGPDALVIQFDAHLDVYNLADCTTELSHGNFLLHAEGPLPRDRERRRPRLVPAGRRMSANIFASVHAAEDVAGDPDAVVNELRKLAQSASRVWIDLDCDVFDPAYFPAVQHPLPMGLCPAFVLRLLSAVWSEKVVGVSVQSSSTRAATGRIRVWGRWSGWSSGACCGGSSESPRPYGRGLYSLSRYTANDASQCSPA